MAFGRGDRILSHSLQHKQHLLHLHA
jgi:hypothetical protein